MNPYKKPKLLISSSLLVFSLASAANLNTFTYNNKNYTYTSPHVVYGPWGVGPIMLRGGNKDTHKQSYQALYKKFPKIVSKMFSNNFKVDGPIRYEGNFSDAIFYLNVYGGTSTGYLHFNIQNEHGSYPIKCHTYFALHKRKWKLSEKNLCRDRTESVITVMGCVTEAGEMLLPSSTAYVPNLLRYGNTVYKFPRSKSNVNNFSYAQTDRDNVTMNGTVYTNTMYIDFRMLSPEVDKDKEIVPCD